MRLHRVACDCGYRTPWYRQPSRAAAAGRQHTCRSDTPRALPAVTTAGRVDDDKLLQAAHAAVRIVTARHDDAVPGSSYDEVELQSDALLGVARAVRDWRPDGGASLYTYAKLRAVSAVRDGIRDRGPVPRKAYSEGVRPEDLPASRRPALSSEALAARGWSPRVPDFTARVDESDALTRALAALPPREEYVVRASVLRGDRLRTIGAALGVSEARACQLRAAALAKLRETMSA